MALSGARDPRFTDRLVRALQASGKTQNEVAREVGASQSTASDWFNKEAGTIPTGDFLLKLPDALGVAPLWLFYGDGSMYAPPERDTKLEQVQREGIVMGARSTMAEVRLALEKIEQEILLLEAARRGKTSPSSGLLAAARAYEEGVRGSRQRKHRDSHG